MIAPAALSDAVRELLTLPAVTVRRDPTWGLTLVASGTDAEVRGIVWKYASMFGMKPTVVNPAPVHPGWRTNAPGWICVELPNLGIEVTVAGRLTDGTAAA